MRSHDSNLTSSLLVRFFFSPFLRHKHGSSFSHTCQLLVGIFSSVRTKRRSLATSAVVLQHPVASLLRLLSHSARAHLLLQMLVLYHWTRFRITASSASSEVVSINEMQKWCVVLQTTVHKQGNTDIYSAENILMTTQRETVRTKAARHVAVLDR